MTSTDLQRTIRRSVAVLAIPLAVVADSVRTIAVQQYFAKSMVFARILTHVVFFGAIAYLIYSFVRENDAARETVLNIST